MGSICKSNFAPATLVAVVIAISPSGAAGFGVARQTAPDPFIDGHVYLVARHAPRHFARQPPPTSAEAVVEEQEPGGATGEALAACEKGLGKPENFSLPGTKGEIKLDRCYRGREQLVCSLAALSLQAKALVQDFAKIIDSNYPDVAHVDAICGMAPENLAAHMEKSSTFVTRFRDLRNEYDRRLACVSKVEQSLQQVSLADMPRSDEILKSMNDALETDIKDVAATRQRLMDLAERMDASQKAIAVIQKIHRTMCFAQPTEPPPSAAAPEKSATPQPPAAALQPASGKK